MTAHTDLSQRIDRFEFRLARLEEFLGVVNTNAEDPSTAQQVPGDFDSSAEIDEPHSDISPSVSVIDYHRPPPALPPRQSDLEQTIGLKWAGWIGAIVLVIGAALGIKFAYEQGWFAIVTPAVGLVLLALGGVALIATGEWVYRKVNALSAAGLFGAGVAVLFVVSYAGYRYYDLYTPGSAFVLMGVCTLIGAGVARRGQLVSIAVLSLIGGALAPALLNQGHSALCGFLAYLLMLQCVSLLLAAWGATPKWWTLRGLSLATTSVWVAAASNTSPRETLFAFVVLFAILYQAELIGSAWRSRLGKAHMGAGFSLLVTALFILMGLHLLEDFDTTTRTSLVLATAGSTGAIAIVCRKSRLRSAALRGLAIGFATQTLALVVLAVPVGLPGRWVAAAWAGLAVMVAIAGRFCSRLTSSAYRLCAQATPIISLAVVKWIAVDTLAARLIAPWTPAFAIASGVAVLTSLICIYLLTSKPAAQGVIPGRIQHVLVGQCVAVLFWLGTFGIDQLFSRLHLGRGSLFRDPRRAEQVAISIFWSLFALISIACGFGWRAAALRYFALVLFAVTLLKVVAIDLSQISGGYRILSFMGVGLLLLATSVVYGKVSPMFNPDGHPATATAEGKG